MLSGPGTQFLVQSVFAKLSVYINSSSSTLCSTFTLENKYIHPGKQVYFDISANNN